MRLIGYGLLLMWLLQNAQQLPWHEGEGFATMGENDTPATTRHQAETNARRKAIETANHIEIASKTIVDNTGLGLDLVTAYSEGLIVGEQIDESRPEVQMSGGKPYINWIVKLRAQVTPPRTVRHDPDFLASLSLEGGKTVFNEGDNLSLTVKPTKDAYIHVFNVGADGKVTTLIPNRYHPEKFVRAGTTLRFPSPDEERRGIHLTAMLPNGAPSSEEKIAVIATKRDIDLVGKDFRDAEFKEYDGKDTGLITELYKKLYALGDAEWVQDVAPYRIFKRK